jgi:hypothetical protein
LKKFLYKKENQINGLTTKKLENDRDELIKNLELYENNSQELQKIISSIKVKEKNDLRRNQMQDTLITQIDILESENNVSKFYILLGRI